MPGQRFNMAKQAKIKILGRVQRVSFRFFAQKKAEEFGLVGFVKNQEDGSVYIEAEGKEVELRKFIRWCRQGPESAKVEKIDLVISSPEKDFKRFEIRY